MDMVLELHHFLSDICLRTDMIMIYLINEITLPIKYSITKNYDSMRVARCPPFPYSCLFRHVVLYIFSKCLLFIVSFINITKEGIRTIT